MKYRIRKAKRKDIKNIIDLAVEMVELSVSPFRDIPLDEVREFRLNDLKSLYLSMNNPNMGIFIAESMEGEFMGHVISMNNFTESSTGEVQGYIFDLSVKKKFQRLGIGKHLMEVAEDFCKEGGMKFLGLNVTATNAPAVEFYESQGYLLERKRMVKPLEKTGGKDADI